MMCFGIFRGFWPLRCCEAEGRRRPCGLSLCSRLGLGSVVIEVRSRCT
jgi:hypothetical protein